MLLKFELQSQTKNICGFTPTFFFIISCKQILKKSYNTFEILGP